MNFLGQGFQNSEHEQDIQTHRQTRLNALPAAVAGDNNSVESGTIVVPTLLQMIAHDNMTSVACKPRILYSGVYSGLTTVDVKKSLKEVH